MSDKIIDRDTYRSIKKMSREELQAFLVRYADELRKDAPTIDLREVEKDIKGVKGIGEKRAEEIMRIAWSITTSEHTSRRRSLVTYPGRSILTESSPSIAITVDSRPISDCPPSTTAAILPFISRITCCADVGLGYPEILADGAAIGLPESSISLCITGCEGTRIPTVSRPPDVIIGILSFLGRIIVRGPGQKCSASL